MTNKLLLVLAATLFVPLLNAGEVKNSNDDILFGVKQIPQEEMASVTGEYYLFQIVYPESGRPTESEQWGSECDYGHLIVNGDTGMEISGDIYQPLANGIHHSWWDADTGWHSEILNK